MEQICVFCKTSSSPFEDQLGMIFRIENHDFHPNCLMYSFHIRQNPDRTKGVYGFESDNIDLALRRCENIICAVCSKPGATVRCFGHDETGISCETSFHLPCALESKRTLHRHYGKFETYCWEHIQSLCIFHGEPITGIQSNTPCCDQLYSCEECITEYANISKDLTKCPICGSVQVFRHFVEAKSQLKIAKGEPLYATSSLGYDGACSAEICLVPGEEEGEDDAERRTYWREGSDDYELFPCYYCGSNPIHPKCRREFDKNADTSEWVCQDCDLSTSFTRRTGDSLQTQTTECIEIAPKRTNAGGYWKYLRDCIFSIFELWP